LHEAEWQAPGSLTICAKTSDQSAGDEFATRLPKPPTSVNVRTPATRVPSASARCCQPRSTPISEPEPPLQARTLTTTCRRWFHWSAHCLITQDGQPCQHCADYRTNYLGKLSSPRSPRFERVWILIGRGRDGGARWTKSRFRGTLFAD